MSDAIPVVNDQELAEHGFIPGNIIASPRYRQWPVKLRHNDDLVERTDSGAISVSMGFFSASQIAFRQIVGRIMCEKFAEGRLGPFVLPEQSDE